MSYLSANITREAGTTAIITVKGDNGQTFYYNKTLNNNGSYSTSNLIGLATCETTYTATVKLIDRAKNTSDVSVPQKVTTSECPRCMGGERNGWFNPIHSEKVRITEPHRTQGGYIGHTGLDMNVGAGIYGEPIYAARAGIVDYYGYDDDGYGNYVDVNHGDGYITRYGHFQSPPLVKKGYVDQNTILGYMGSTGNSTGPHLHFEILTGGRWTKYGAIDHDPELYINIVGKNISQELYDKWCEGEGGEGGTSANPWGKQTIKDLANPKLRLFVNDDGDVKYSDTKKTYAKPQSKITFVKPYQDGSGDYYIKVYGLGLYNNARIDDTIVREDDVWWDDEYKINNHNIDRAKIILFKKGVESGNYRIAAFENTDTDGKWQTCTPGDATCDSKYPSDTYFGSHGNGDIKVGPNERIDFGDEICVRTRVYGGGIKVERWGFDFTVDYDKGLYSRSGSGESRTDCMKVDQLPIAELKGEIKDKYGVSFEEDGSAWTEDDLNSIKFGLEKLPSKFFAQDMVFIKENSDANKTNGCRIYPNGTYTGGYVGGSLASNEVVICSLSEADNPKDTGIAGTAIHEMTDVYQKVLSTKDIKTGHNIVNDTNNPLHQYYDIIFESNNPKGYWSTDANIVNNNTTEGCRTYGNGINQTNPGRVFVSWYSCIQSTVGENGRFLPEEEMAEVVRIYYLNQSYLETQDESPDVNNNSMDLKRYEFIRDNIVN